MGWLTIVQGIDLGQCFEVRDGDVLGRAPDNAICIPHHQLSRRHCAFFVTDEGRTGVRDLRASFGVLINQERVDTEVALLNHGDELSVICATLLFTVVKPDGLDTLQR
jgi:pSer/pThr/pTyr-binding forkhead associated (FHA) protein